MSDKHYLTVDFDKIATDKKFLSVTRMLAIDLQKTPYMTVGDFMNNLSNEDLDTLLAASEEEHPHFSEMILIAEMLAGAEGLLDEAKSDDEMVNLVMDRTQALVMFLAIEGLGRKGLVKVYHENMSFGEDMGDKLVVEKLF